MSETDSDTSLNIDNPAVNKKFDDFEHIALKKYDSNPKAIANWVKLRTLLLTHMFIAQEMQYN